MPWKETSVLEQRRAFIEDVLAGRGSVRALCEKYGISEKTGHKWKRRFMESGLAGLADESRAPHSSPAKLDEDAVIRVLGIRRAHPTWGPRKIAALYARAYPGRPAPSESSIYRVLGKAGLVAPRRVRAAPCGSAGVDAQADTRRVAQRRVDGGLQGVVGYTYIYLPAADRARPGQQGDIGGQADGVGLGRGGQGEVRGAFLEVRPAEGHQERQRRALRHDNRGSSASPRSARGG